MNKTIQKKKGIIHMEILQKVTLYDLLGYAVPGTCLLTVILGICVYGSDVVFQTDYVGYLCGIIILFGYVIGIAISEVTDAFLKRFLKKTNWFKTDQKDLEVRPEVLAAALEKAGLKQAVLEMTNQDNDLLDKYQSFIYADIQADPDYSRVHNYASAALICKNMAFVSFVTTIEGTLFAIGNWPLLILIVGIGIILIWAFMSRWRKNYWRKYQYANAWFIQKYNGGQ